MAGLPARLKFELSNRKCRIPLSLLWSQTTYWKKSLSLIAFRQILPKTFPAAYIFSYAIITNSKKLIGNKSLDTKQYPAGLSSRIIHYPHQPSWEALGMGENSSQQQKMYSFFSPEISFLLNKFTSSSIKSVSPSPSYSNFHSMIL